MGNEFVWGQEFEVGGYVIFGSECCLQLMLYCYLWDQYYFWCEQWLVWNWYMYVVCQQCSQYVQGVGMVEVEIVVWVIYYVQCVVWQVVFNGLFIVGMDCFVLLVDCFGLVRVLLCYNIGLFSLFMFS